jgi:hypothetical protein
MWLLIGLAIILYFLISSSEHFHGTYIMPFASRINRPTRNMSYDLRGEAYYPPLLNLPFDNSSIEPIPQPELISKNIFV